MKNDMLKSAVVLFNKNGTQINCLSIEPVEQLQGKILKSLRSQAYITIFGWVSDMLPPHAAKTNNPELTVWMEDFFAANISEAAVQSKSDLAIAQMALPPDMLARG